MLYLVWILSLRASRQTQLFSDYRALKIEKCYCAIFTLNDHKYSLKTKDLAFRLLFIVESINQ